MESTVIEAMPDRSMRAPFSLDATGSTRLGLVLERLRERLTPRGLLLFEALLCDQQASDQVCARFDITANAVYSFRNRLPELGRGDQSREHFAS